MLKENGAKTLPEIAAALTIENKDIGSAFGQLSKDGVLKMNAEKKAEYTGSALPKRISIASTLLKRAAESENGLLDNDALSEDEKTTIAGMAKKRGASDSPFKIIERETVSYCLTPKADEVCAALVNYIPYFNFKAGGRGKLFRIVRK